MCISKCEFCSFSSSVLLFNISIITATASSTVTDGYNFTTSKEIYIFHILGDIFHSFASSTNEDEFITLCLFLFKVGCIAFTKYFEASYDAGPIVDTTARMG